LAANQHAKKMALEMQASPAINNLRGVTIPSMLGWISSVIIPDHRVHEHRTELPIANLSNIV
jgi:hypothetical protein